MPAHIPARPIGPDTPTLKFLQPEFFWVRNFPDKKIFGAKFEKPENFWIES